MILNLIASSLRRDLQQRLAFRWTFVLELLSTVSMLLVFFLVDRFQNQLFGHQLIGAAAHLNTSYFGYVALGLAVAGLANTGLSGALGQIYQEKSAQTLEVLMSSPVSIRDWAVATGVCGLLRALGKFLMIFSVAVLVLQLRIPRFDLFACAAVLLTSALPLWCLSVLILATGLVFRRGNPLNFLLSLAFDVLGGVYVPQGVLPHRLAELGGLLPITPAVRAMQSVVYGGAGLAQISGDLAQLAVLTLLYLPIALLVLKKSDHICRMKGYYCLS